MGGGQWEKDKTTPSLVVVVIVLLIRWVVGEGQDNDIIYQMPFPSTKLLLCCNSPSTNWIHPSMLHSAVATVVFFVVNQKGM